MPRRENPFDEHRSDSDRPEASDAHHGPGIADDVEFGRSGLHDAPPPLGRGWLVLGACLLATVIATAVAIGTGAVSAEEAADDGRDVIESAETSAPDDARPGVDRDGVSDLTRAKGACLGIIRDQRNADSTGGLGIPPATEDLTVAYEHQGTDYATVLVTDGGVSVWCASSDGGLSSTRYQSGEAPDPLSTSGRLSFTSAADPGELIVGDVAEGVDQVEILANLQSVGQAHVADGHFSARVSPDSGAKLAYAVSFADGRREVVNADQVTNGPASSQLGTAALACLSYLNITVAEPEPAGNRAKVEFDSAYELLAEHVRADYLLAAATDGDTLTACLEAPGITWVANEPDALPPGALIASLQITVSNTNNERTPLVGQVADSVTAVDVLTTDGQRIETHLEDGFFVVVMPTGDIVDVTYVVREEGGETTTVVPDQT